MPIEQSIQTSPCYMVIEEARASLGRPLRIYKTAVFPPLGRLQRHERQSNLQDTRTAFLQLD